MTARSSFIWSIGQFFCSVIIEFGGLMVMARLLTPAQFGLFASAMAVMQFSQFLSGFGMQSVVVRSDISDKEMRRKITGLSLLAGGTVTLCLGAAVLFLPLAWFAAPPRQLMLIMIALPLLASITTLSFGMLTREMRFKTIFVQRLTAALVFQITAIPLAVLGHGASSLAWAILASTAVFALLSVIATKGAFLIRPSFRNLGPVTGFASTIFTTNVLDNMSLAAIPLLIGRIAGFGPLGHYTRSTDLIRQARRIVQDAIMPVVIPLVIRGGPDPGRLRPLYLQMVTHLSVVCWPIAGLLMIFAEPIVRILLGTQWPDVVPLLQILALGIPLYPLNAGMRTFAVAMHLERALLYRQILLTAAQIGAACLIVPLDLNWFCGAMVGIDLVFAVVCFHLIAPPLRVRPPDLAGALWRSGLIAIACLVPAYLFTFLPTGELLADLVRLCLAVVVAGLVWLGAIQWLHHPLGAEIQRLLARFFSRPTVTEG